MEVGVSTIGYGHDSGGLNFVRAASTVDTCVGSRAHVCFGSVPGSPGSVLVSPVQCDGQVCLAITDTVSFWSWRACEVIRTCMICQPSTLHFGWAAFFESISWVTSVSYFICRFQGQSLGGAWGHTPRCIPKQYLWEVGQKAGVSLREISPISSVRVRCENLEDQAGMSMSRCTSGGV